MAALNRRSAQLIAKVIYSPLVCVLSTMTNSIFKNIIILLMEHNLLFKKNYICI